MVDEKVISQVVGANLVRILLRCHASSPWLTLIHMEKEKNKNKRTIAYHVMHSNDKLFWLEYYLDFCLPRRFIHVT